MNNVWMSVPADLPEQNYRPRNALSLAGLFCGSFPFCRCGTRCTTSLKSASICELKLATPSFVFCQNFSRTALYSGLNSLMLIWLGINNWKISTSRALASRVTDLSLTHIRQPSMVLMVWTDKSVISARFSCVNPKFSRSFLILWARIWRIFSGFPFISIECRVI